MEKTTIDELIDEKIADKIAQLQRQIDQLKPKRYLTRKEAAKLYRVSMTTIDLEIKRGELESTMIRGNRRIIVRD
jgi:excisionase family DNA binding protein